MRSAYICPPCGFCAGGAVVGVGAGVGVGGAASWSGSTNGMFGKCGHLTAGSVGDIDAGVIEQQSGGSIELDPRFLISRFGRNQIRLARRQCGGVLQDRDLRSQSNFQFLLIGIQRLAREVDGGLRCFHGDAVLFYIKLCIAHFDSHLVFQLVLAHLRLAVFQFGAHLVRLCQAVAKRNVQRQSRPLCQERWKSPADSRVLAVSNGSCRAEGRRRGGLIEAKRAGRVGAVGNGRD